MILLYNMGSVFANDYIGKAAVIRKVEGPPTSGILPQRWMSTLPVRKPGFA